MTWAGVVTVLITILGAGFFTLLGVFLAHKWQSRQRMKELIATMSAVAEELLVDYFSANKLSDSEARRYLLQIKSYRNELSLVDQKRKELSKNIYDLIRKAYPDKTKQSPTQKDIKKWLSELKQLMENQRNRPLRDHPLWKRLQKELGIS